MTKSRFTEQQVLEFLKQGQMGVSVADLCRRNGTTRRGLMRM